MRRDGKIRCLIKQIVVELEFLNSPDRDVLGKRVIYFDEISLGRSRANMVIVDDPGVEKKDIRLSVTESGVFVENCESAYYFSNDKKVSGKKLHSQGDSIRVGNTTLKILSFKPADFHRPDYDSLYQEQIQPVPYKDQLFDAIKQEMDDLETF